jgi:hypothetical protein
MKSKLYVFCFVVVPLAVIALTVTNADSKPSENDSCHSCHSNHHLAYDNILIINTVLVGSYCNSNGNFAMYKIEVQDKHPQGEGWGVFEYLGGYEEPFQLQKVADSDSGEIFNTAALGKTYVVKGVDRNKDNNDPTKDGYWNVRVINPTVLVELCGNSIDDDCDGKADDGDEEGCCPPDPLGEICGNSKDDDCDGTTDEGDPFFGGCCPNSTEICGNFINDDCDDQVDELDCCSDFDGDGFFAEAGCGTAVDCDDSDPNINPNNVWYYDNDGDTFGTPSVTTEACTQPVKYVSNNTDCDDGDDKIHPNTVWHRDGDNDGYGARFDKYPNATSTPRCDRPEGYKLASELELEGAINIDCHDDNENVIFCYNPNPILKGIFKVWDDKMQKRQKNPPAMKKIKSRFDNLFR